jgi:hypothetical protein
MAIQHNYEGYPIGPLDYKVSIIDGPEFCEFSMHNDIIYFPYQDVNDKPDSVRVVVQIDSERGRSPFLLIIGLAEEAVLCELLQFEQRRPLKDIMREDGTWTRSQPWIEISGKVGDLASAKLQLHDVETQVKLHQEHSAEPGGEVAGKRKHYLAVFTFGWNRQATTVLPTTLYPIEDLVTSQFNESYLV